MPAPFGPIRPSTPPAPANWKSDGYLQEVPSDPWGAPYQYSNEDEKLKIYSFGPKGKEGNSPIGNWNMNDRGNGNGNGNAEA